MRLLFDDLVGAGEDCGRDRQAERLGGLQVDDKIEFDWLLDWQIAGLGALQDAIDIVRRSAEVVRHVGAVGREAAIVGVFSLRIDRRRGAPG